MKLKEKVMKLHQYCCGSNGCEECEHKDNPYCTNYDVFKAPKKVINEWYNLFFGNPENDAVNHPSHYADGKIECIDYIQDKLTKEEFQGYCKGNALKYISRAGKKNPDKYNEDLQKAIWYLKRATNDGT